MTIEDIEMRILRDVNQYYQIYEFPYSCDQLRRIYHHYTKKFKYEFFQDYLNELNDNGKLFVTHTPSGKKVCLPYEVAMKVIERDGSLTELLITYDKSNGVRRHRSK